MKQLFLSASFVDAKEQFTEYIKTVSQEKTVTFIPAASLVEEVTFYVDDALALFKELGFVIEILDLTVAAPEEIATTLQKNNFIYISGGNTFYLLDVLKKSGAFALILHHIADGKIYIGESAGSVIAAASIDYIAEMDDKSKAPIASSYPGLNLVPFAIVPHYQAEYFAESAETILHKYQADYALIPLKNEQVMIVDGAHTEIR